MNQKLDYLRQMKIEKDIGREIRNNYLHDQEMGQELGQDPSIKKQKTDFDDDDYSK